MTIESLDATRKSPDNKVGGKSILLKGVAKFTAKFEVTKPAQATSPSLQPKSDPTKSYLGTGQFASQEDEKSQNTTATGWGY